MSTLGRMLGFGRSEEYDRGIRLFDQGLYEEAIAAFSRVRSGLGQDPVTARLAQFYTAEAQANLGTAAMKRGAWDRAERHYREALAIHPHYADLHFNLAIVLRHRLCYTDALEELDRAIEINPRYARAHFQQGLVLYAAGNRDAGLAAMAHAVELEPGFRTDAYDRGLSAHEDGDYAGALYALDTVADTEIDDLLFHLRLGDDLYRRGMFAQASDEYHKALELNPNYADVWDHLGLARSAEGRTGEAVAAFRKALEINPAFSGARLNLAVALRELGCPEEAAGEFRTVLESEPDNVVARENLEREAQAPAA